MPVNDVDRPNILVRSSSFSPCRRYRGLFSQHNSLKRALMLKRHSNPGRWWWRRRRKWRTQQWGRWRWFGRTNWVAMVKCSRWWQLRSIEFVKSLKHQIQLWDQRMLNTLQQEGAAFFWLAKACMEEGRTNSVIDRCSILSTRFSSMAQACRVSVLVDYNLPNRYILILRAYPLPSCF